jgi:hypothetical protein
MVIAQNMREAPLVFLTHMLDLPYSLLRLPVWALFGALFLGAAGVGRAAGFARTVRAATRVAGTTLSLAVFALPSVARSVAPESHFVLLAFLLGVGAAACAIPEIVRMSDRRRARIKTSPTGAPYRHSAALAVAHQASSRFEPGYLLLLIGCFPLAVVAWGGHAFAALTSTSSLARDLGDAPSPPKLGELVGRGPRVVPVVVREIERTSPRDGVAKEREPDLLRALTTIGGRDAAAYLERRFDMAPTEAGVTRLVRARDVASGPLLWSHLGRGDVPNSGVARPEPVALAALDRALDLEPYASDRDLLVEQAMCVAVGMDGPKRGAFEDLESLLQKRRKTPDDALLEGLVRFSHRARAVPVEAFFLAEASTSRPSAHKACEEILESRGVAAIRRDDAGQACSEEDRCPCESDGPDVRASKVHDLRVILAAPPVVTSSECTEETNAG